MREAFEVARYKGRILVAFATRDELKDYLRSNCPDLDPYDVEIRTEYLTEKYPTGIVPR